MRGLNDLVQSGKVLYLAISDTPAWQVVRCNMIAEHYGWAPFICYQVQVAASAACMASVFN